MLPAHMFPPPVETILRQATAVIITGKLAGLTELTMAERRMLTTVLGPNNDSVLPDRLL